MSPIKPIAKLPLSESRRRAIDGIKIPPPDLVKVKKLNNQFGKDSKVTLYSRSQSLLERIRAKEKLHIAETPESKANKILLHSIERLLPPSRYLSSIFTLLSTSGRLSFSKSEIQNVLIQAASNVLGDEEADNLIQALSIACPSWVSIYDSKISVVKFSGAGSMREEVTEHLNKHYHETQKKVHPNAVAS